MAQNVGPFGMTDFILYPMPYRTELYLYIYRLSACDTVCVQVLSDCSGFVGSMDMGKDTGHGKSLQI